MPNNPLIPQDPFNQGDPFNPLNLIPRSKNSKRKPVYGPPDPSKNPFAGVNASARVGSGARRSSTGDRRGDLNSLIAKSKLMAAQSVGKNMGTFDPMTMGGMSDPFPQFQGMDFATALQQALGMIPQDSSAKDAFSAASRGVDNRIAAAKRNSSEADARIAAMYAEANKLQQDQMQGAADQAAAAITARQGLADHAQEQMQAGRDANRQAEADLTGYTGLGDSELMKQQRGYADTDSQGAVGRVQESAANQAMHIGNLGDANQLYRQGISTAVSQQGLQTRDALNRGLLNTLAALEDERTNAQIQMQQAQAQNQMQRQAMAMQLAQQMQGDAYNRYKDGRDFQYNLDNRNWDRAWQTEGRAQDNMLSQYDLEQKYLASQQPQKIKPSDYAALIKAFMSNGMSPQQAQAEAQKALTGLGY